MDSADTRMSPDASASVTALYAEHALGLVRLAVVMTGDRAAAEDIVQDASASRRDRLVARFAAPGAPPRAAVIDHGAW